MTYKEETEYLVSELEKLGYSRGEIEVQLAYSPNYIGQMLTRGSNAKMVAALKMLLKMKAMENRLQEIDKKKEEPETEMQAVIRVLKDIAASLHGTAHNTALNQALIKAGLSRSAKLEAMVTHRNQAKDQQKILDELNEDVARIFFETHDMEARSTVPA